MKKASLTLIACAVFGFSAVAQNATNGHFKLALPPFEICDSLCKRLILLAEFLGLRLDIRKLTGMRCRCDGEDRRYR